jgi:NAD(P)-dependent dehydrogenase (short-subunit alcohol dehydrogenase family)
LDAHVSGRRVARALRKDGHDVRAADEERDLDGMTDEDLLALATSEKRILVTFNVADLPDIARRWAEQGTPHHGCAIVVGIDHSEFGTIIRIINRTLAARPDTKEWRDYTVFVARGL